MSVYEQMYKRGEWNCFMCAKWFGRRDVLRQHLIIHYKKEIRKQYMSNGEDTNNVCTICGDETRDAKALLQHIALGNHQKLRDCLPDFLSKLLFTGKVSHRASLDDGSHDVFGDVVATNTTT